MAESSLAHHARSGIYEIVNTVNGKRYVGSAVNIERRFSTHRRMLIRGKHHSRKLQNSWDKHGEAAFLFRRILICEPGYLLMYEQIFIDSTAPEYNICRVAGSTLGIKWPDEIKAKVAKTRKNDHFRGRTHSAETIEKMSNAQRGNTATKGKKRSADAVEKTATAHKGMKRSAETRERIRQKALGRKRSPESIEKGAAKLRGVAMQPERVAKLLSNQHAAGRRQSPEEKAQRSASVKAAWDAKKAAGIPWRPPRTE